MTKGAAGSTRPCIPPHSPRGSTTSLWPSSWTEMCRVEDQVTFNSPRLASSLCICERLVVRIPELRPVGRTLAICRSFHERYFILACQAIRFASA